VLPPNWASRVLVSKAVNGRPPAKGAGIYFKHADVDIETFHPQTIAFIVAVMAIFQSNDLRELVGFLVDRPRHCGRNRTEQVFEDILVARNQRLLTEIESSLKVSLRGCPLGSHAPA
jgi:hypothetical protein